MIVELNRDVSPEAIPSRTCPEVLRGPDGLLYDVAIIDAANPPQFIYSSEARPLPGPCEFAGRDGASVQRAPRAGI